MKREVLKKRLAREQYKGFMQGVAYAVACANRMFDEPTLCAEVLRTAGTYRDYVKAGVDEYDKKELRKILKWG